MPRTSIAALAALVVSSSLALAQGRTVMQQPQSYSSNVAAKCTSDAGRLCPEHALGSSEMRYCMEAKARMISRDCMIALEDDGIVPRGTVKNARR